jgi:hypothetical protein
MKYVEYKDRTYRISGDGMVEVRIPMGEPRVMQLSPRSAHWRTLKSNSKVAVHVRLYAEKVERKEQRR